MNVPPDVIAAIRGARSILCATHSPMDGDGLGCGLALERAFEAEGKKVVLVTEAPVPSVYAFLPGYESIVVLGKEPVPKADLIVALDAGGPDRLARAERQRRAATDSPRATVLT